MCHPRFQFVVMVALQVLSNPHSHVFVSMVVGFQVGGHGVEELSHFFMSDAEIGLDYPDRLQLLNVVSMIDK